MVNGAQHASSKVPGVVSRTRNPVRRAFHLVASLLGWVAFGYGWFFIFWRPLDRSAISTFELLLLVLLGIITVNALWVSFNQEMYRQRPLRTRLRTVTVAGTTDRLGRPLVGADWPRLRLTGWITVRVDSTRRYKIYQPGAGGTPEDHRGQNERCLPPSTSSSTTRSTSPS